MNLFVVATMFSKMGEDELTKRLQAWGQWWSKHGSSVQKRYKVNSWNLLELLPGRDIYVGGQRPIRIELPKESTSLVQKGLAVRFAILAALDRVDRHGIEARSNAVFALLDGSGAFDYANINNLLDALLTPPVPDVVFGLRPTGQCGMAGWRKAVEEFENFLVVQRLPDNANTAWIEKGRLPDGQAGCWAFRMSSIKNLAISASGYDIEYDLLASSMLGNLNISFTKPLTMRERGTTEFGTTPTPATIQICINKLDFIQYKLDLSDAEILLHLSNFRGEFPEQSSLIPTEYYSEVETRYRSF